MDINEKRFTWKVLTCIAIWFLGLWVGSEILERTGNLYSMLDENISNPDYDPEFHGFMANVGYGWTAVCIALGYFWTKSTNDK